MAQIQYANSGNKPVYASSKAKDAYKSTLEAGPSGYGGNTPTLGGNLSDALLRSSSGGAQGQYGHIQSPGSGQDFIVGRRWGAVEGLRDALTDREAGDFEGRAAMRESLADALSQYGGAADTREQNFMANQERGLARNVAQLRRQMGGAGLGRSSQANRSLGELLASSQRETGQGLNQLQLQKGQELGQLAAIQGQVLQQSLLERGFTLQQAKTLSDLLQRQSEAEQGMVLGTMTQPGPSDFEKYLGYGLQTLGALNSGAPSGGGGGGGGMAGMAAMFGGSDFRIKENVEPGAENIEAFLDSLAPHTYDYTDMAFGIGKHTSVMAQDLEKTEAGRSLVFEREDGVKMVNYAKAFGLMLATNVHLHQKIKAMEAKLNA